MPTSRASPETTMPKHLAHRLRAAGVPASKSATAVDVIGDQRLWDRELYRFVTDHREGQRPILGPSWRMARSPARIERGAPTSARTPTTFCTRYFAPDHRREAEHDADIDEYPGQNSGPGDRRQQRYRRGNGEGAGRTRGCGGAPGAPCRSAGRPESRYRIRGRHSAGGARRRHRCRAGINSRAAHRRRVGTTRHAGEQRRPDADGARCRGVPAGLG